SPDDPLITSAFPSPSTSAIAGAVTIIQPSIGIGYEGSQLPLAASQPPSRCSNGSFVDGADCAAASRESTMPPNRPSAPPRVTRPKAALAPSASADGAVALEPGPVPANSKWLCPPGPPMRVPSPR